jgi:putative transposase
MARMACPQLPGVPLHLVLRREAADPAACLERLRGVPGAMVHAYVLMGTHAHLLLTPLGVDGARPMIDALKGRDVDATPVTTRRYVLACMRYIELNPVRAGLVRHPAHYRWSSYRANALGDADPLLSPHALYCALGRSTEERCAAYRAGVRVAATSRARSPAC